MLLLDTNIVSFLFRNDSRLALYHSALANHVHAISFATLAELYKWPIERRFGTPRVQALETLLRSFAVLPVDDALARRWAELSVTLKRAGIGTSESDLWIAATALRHSLTLVTHNRKHFERIPGLTLISHG